MSDLDRIKQAMVDGEHTDGDLQWAVDEIDRLQASVTELEAVLRGYVKATTGQESATVTFPMALEGEEK